MVNEPTPFQLTVHQLKKALEQADENAVVTLKVPPGGIGHPKLSVFKNLKVNYSGGPVFKLEPFEGEATCLVPD